MTITLKDLGGLLNELDEVRWELKQQARDLDAFYQVNLLYRVLSDFLTNPQGVRAINHVLKTKSEDQAEALRVLRAYRIIRTSELEGAYDGGLDEDGMVAHAERLVAEDPSLEPNV